MLSDFKVENNSTSEILWLASQQPIQIYKTCFIYSFMNSLEST